jgi:hypothetical protein
MTQSTQAVEGVVDVGDDAVGGGHRLCQRRNWRCRLRPHQWRSKSSPAAQVGRLGGRGCGLFGRGLGSRRGRRRRIRRRGGQCRHDGAGGRRRHRGCDGRAGEGLRVAHAVAYRAS